MKKLFIASLICRNGIIGGAVYIEDRAITYRTNKLTVDTQYNNISLPLEDIRGLTWKWIVFPVATLQMQNGKQYRFILFNKRRFTKCYAEAKGLDV